MSDFLNEQISENRKVENERLKVESRGTGSGAAPLPDRHGRGSGTTADPDDMAGSYNYCKNEDGSFTFELIENFGDAQNDKKQRVYLKISVLIRKIL